MKAKTIEELIKHRIEIYQEAMKKVEVEKDISSQMYLRGAIEELKFIEQNINQSEPIVSEPTVKEPSKGDEDLNQSIETILFSAYLVGEESISTGTNFKSWFERNNVLDSIKKLFHTPSEITYEEVFNQENRDKVKEYILSQLNNPNQVTDDEMYNELDVLILNWLKSGNENTTQLSFDIVQYFKGLSLQNKELWIGNIS